MIPLIYVGKDGARPKVRGGCIMSMERDCVPTM